MEIVRSIWLWGSQDHQSLLISRGAVGRRQMDLRIRPRSILFFRLFFFNRTHLSKLAEMFYRITLRKLLLGQRYIIRALFL